jgi:hypothetical protein
MRPLHKAHEVSMSRGDCVRPSVRLFACIISETTEGFSIDV